MPSHKADERHQEKRGRSAAEREEFLRAAWRVIVDGVVDPTKLWCSSMSVAPTPRWLLCTAIVPKGRSYVCRCCAAEVLEAYLEQVLLPELQEGQVVVMDSLPAHKPGRVRELIEGRGCELLYLPGYYPDYNPIEEAFSKIKEILRRACARTREALLEALGEALSAVSLRDAQGFFEHAGYRSMGQLL